MAISYVTSGFGAVGTNGNGYTTGSFNSSGGNLAVTGGASGNFGSGSLAAITFSDSKSNSWTSLTKTSAFTSWRSACQLAYKLTPSVGSGHTVSGSCSDNTAGGAAIFSGVASFGAESAGGNSGSGTTCQPGSLTPSEDNCLLLTALCFCRNTGDADVSIDNGFTIIDQNRTNGGQYCIALAYKIQTTAAAINPTWTHENDFGSFVNAVAVMAYWKPATLSIPVFRQHYINQGMM